MTEASYKRKGLLGLVVPERYESFTIAEDNCGREQAWSWSSKCKHTSRSSMWLLKSQSPFLVTCFLQHGLVSYPNSTVIRGPSIPMSEPMGAPLIETTPDRNRFRELRKYGAAAGQR